MATKTHDEDVHTFVVAGNGTWGQGATLAEAKRNFTGHGGRLSRGYETFRFSGETKFEAISGFGVQYTGPAEGLTVHTKAPRKGAI